jgi:hypothetical protein
MYISSLALMSAFLLSGPFESFERRVRYPFLLLLVSILVARFLVLLRAQNLTIDSKGLCIGRKRIPAEFIEEISVSAYRDTYNKVRITSRKSANLRGAVSVRPTFFYVSQNKRTDFLNALRQSFPFAKVSDGQAKPQAYFSSIHCSNALFERRACDILKMKNAVPATKRSHISKGASRRCSGAHRFGFPRQSFLGLPKRVDGSLAR